MKTTYISPKTELLSVKTREGMMLLGFSSAPEPGKAQVARRKVF